jgi:hypothetical protein
LAKEWSFWRAEAEKRIAEGIPCCKYCAKLKENVGVCTTCERVLQGFLQPPWYKYAVRGNVPIISSSTQKDREGLIEEQLVALLRYPQCNSPFTDINDLYEQWKGFVIWHGNRKKE